MGARGMTVRERFRRRRLGPQVSGNRAELAAQLGACQPVLRLSCRCAAHHLHHERHRILERQTPARREREAIFPTDEAAIKLLYLVLRQVAQTWKMPPREWCEAKTQFAIIFDDRFVKA